MEMEYTHDSLGTHTEPTSITNCVSVFTSPPFKFVVGKNEDVITLPTLLVSLCSKPLQKLVSGSMNEATYQVAYLADTDAETFVRFAEYLFTGTYHDPVLQQSQKTSELNLTPDVPIVSSAYEEPASPSSLNNEVGDGPDPVYGWNSLGSVSRHVSSKKLKKGKKARYNYAGKEIDSESLPEPPCTHRHMKSGLPEDPPPDLLISKTVVVTSFDVLSTHAAVYVFADQYDIVGLQALAWNKCREALSKLSSDEEANLKAVMRLVDFAYVNTAERSDRLDPLRNLLTAYAADFLAEFAARDDYRELIQQHPSVAIDIMAHVVKLKY